MAQQPRPAVATAAACTSPLLAACTAHPSLSLSSTTGAKALATPLLLALVCVEISDVLFAVDSVPAVFGVTTDPFLALTSNGFALLGLRALYTIIAQGIDQFQSAAAPPPPPLLLPFLLPAVPAPATTSRVHLITHVVCEATRWCEATCSHHSHHSRHLIISSSHVLPPLAACRPRSYLQTSIALVLGFIGVKLIASFCGFEIDTLVSLLLVLTTLGGGVHASLRL